METKSRDSSKTSPILVTGGTGTLGKLMVSMLRQNGREVRVLSRRQRDGSDGVAPFAGDLTSGSGLDPAMEGVETVVHCAGSAKGDEEKARTLVRAAEAARVTHLVFISVVGADRLPIESRIDRAMFGYFGSKLAAERIISDSGLPFTTLRATQFHEGLLAVARQMTKLPIVPAPAGWRFQPISAAEVAQRLTDLALGEPAGLVPDMGGPLVYRMTDTLRSYMQATGRSRPVVPLWQPGKAARAFRAGGNLAPEQAVGRQTWEEFLAKNVG